MVQLPEAWDADRRAALLLHLISGVGPAAQRLLLERFERPEQVLRATREDLLQTPGIGPKLADRISTAELQQAESEIQRCFEHHIAIVMTGDQQYPTILQHIDDPPAALFLRGAFTDQDALAVAIVGSRHASRYGLQQAERLARALSLEGMTIVSGLARAVDAAAHRGALAAGGRTIAVLASGVLQIYPPEHSRLAAEIVGQGALVSEAPPFRKPISGAFPQRNRLISGMSLGVLVIEAAERSGALITARHALEQGREVFALPGRVDSRMSRGCHQLLRDGAKLVESVDDVLEELGPLVAPMSAAACDDSTSMQIRDARELQLGDQERLVLNLIESEPTHIDVVSRQCDLTMAQLLATVSVLEARRLVERVAGGSFVRL